MKIYIGTDHGGFELKESLKAFLAGIACEVIDCGTYSYENTDYPDYASAVGHLVQDDPGSLGVLLCRSGEGMAIAANKLKGIRAALVWKPEIATETRNDNDSNILVLPADYITPESAEECLANFINTPFSGEERHQRRLDKLASLENDS